MHFDEPPRIPGKKDDPKQIGAWKMGRTIGKGASGRVKLARNAKTGQMAAIKIVSKSFLFSRSESLSQAAEEAEYKELSLQREIIVMKLIEHPNVMRLYDVWDLPDEIYLILEYVQGGELFDYLCEKGRLPASEALTYFQQIIQAVDYCHRFNIAHRDLKPENILLDAEFNVKIADFGMAIFQCDSMLRTSCGSPHYAAPEVISGGAYDGIKADIWSCGIILHALLVGRLPFDDEDCSVLLKKVGKGTFEMPRDIPPLAQDLLRRMLTKDVKRRITMTQIQAHPFFTSQKPKILKQSLPNLESIGRPLQSADNIDPEVLNNLRTLWKDASEDFIIARLTSQEQNWEKGIYHLLCEYRRKRLEEYDQRKEMARNERLHRRKTRAAKVLAETILAQSVPKSELRPSPSSFPPRDDPPTPRRASRGKPLSSASSSDFTLSHRQPILADTANVDDSNMEGIMSPNMALINEIISTNAMRVPVEASVSAPAATKSTSSHPLTIKATSSELSTRPLSIRRRERPELPTLDITNIDDKENYDGSFLVVDFDVKLDLDLPAPSRKSSIRKAQRDVKAGRRHVQILIPPQRKRSKLKKHCDFSPASDTSATSPFAYTDSPLSPSHPRASWFASVFRFKPTSYTLTSTHNVYATRNECRRLLMAMDVRVMLEDSVGLGVLKCRLEETKAKDVGVGHVKSTKFRVEVREERVGYCLALIHERGSLETFREVYGRLRAEWVLDIEGSKSPEQDNA
ncbi:camk camkl gin4 protein kinase [Moniliophthora roreri MCA 2997]|uniref:non-specific serine/threonine protein kinase n=1 Tax=Moniliophthora roreri (strain MCA 2997) TaxID=1381753 RepID=V2YTB7_MONRO|nr:camk camkl gin4 protein kinase [Moniliophthora roreri MCA 2997]